MIPFIFKNQDGETIVINLAHVDSIRFTSSSTWVTTGEAEIEVTGSDGHTLMIVIGLITKNMFPAGAAK